MTNKKGFTLIEMLVVIAIVGILSAVVLTSLGPARSRAKDTRIISGINQARLIAETLYDGSQGKYLSLPADGEVAETDAKFGATATDVKNNGGTLYIKKSDTAYAFYSVLSTTRYYCVDSQGKGLELAGNTAIVAGDCR